ncbi:MAG TPA: sigma-54 dependent transcriptional regulator [Candidatus Binatia bacterium]
MPRLLVIGRDDTTRKFIQGQLADRVAIDSAESLRAGLERHHHQPFDVILWDSVSVPSRCLNPLNTVQKLLRRPAHMRAIILSDKCEPHGITERKLRCDWLQTPVDQTELVARVGTALRDHVPADSGETDGDLFLPTEFEGILAFTLTMKSVIRQILEAAAEDIPVLISGETGTGKDLVATAIHRRSKRQNGPFLPVNMGAMASELIASELFGHERGAYTGALERRAGLFEQAEGGTIFLDELTTMDEKAQVALLRVLENKTIRRVRGEKEIPVDVRVIAATNENIEEAVSSERFREDLYYRLDVFRIQLPPLRERQAAISLFADHFVAHFSRLYRKKIRVVSREMYQIMRQYSWPGNVRELKNVIQRAVLLARGAELTADLLPQRLRQLNGLAVDKCRPQYPIQLGMTLDEVEREYIKMTLASVNGNKMKAASALDISRRALYDKLKRFGML